MDNKTYRGLVMEALSPEVHTAYEFIAALGWQAWMDEPEYDGDPDKIAAVLTEIYAAAHRSVRDIIRECGMSLQDFSDRFCIPYKTVQKWVAATPGEIRGCTIYARLMMQECLGLLHR